MSLVLITPPATEPLTLAETKTYLRIDHSNDDTLVSSMITAAREACETMTGRSLITRTYALYLDRWPVQSGLIRDDWWDGVREGASVSSERTLILPRGPLISVASITIYDAEDAGTAVSASDYFVDTAAVPGRIVLKEGVSPPAPGRVANGIKILFSAGYGAATSDVPAALRQGMKQLAAYMYEHRGDDVNAAMTSSGAAGMFHSYRLAGLA